MCVSVCVVLVMIRSYIAKCLDEILVSLGGVHRMTGTETRLDVVAVLRSFLLFKKVEPLSIIWLVRSFVA